MPIQQTANVLNTFDLDMIPDSAPVIVYCDQGDHGDGRLVIHLVDDGVPYEPIPGALAVIQGTKPDGHSFIYSATIDGSTVIANLTEQMTACYGRTRVQVVVTEGNDRTGTYVFYLQVQKSALPQDPDLSRTDLQLIQQLIDEAESISVNVPYIGANGNWWIYSVSEGGYIDSGVDASITVDIADITMLAPDATPYVTNTGTNTDPIFHLFIPRGQTGATGADGYSPEVTITTITGGHRVTITDEDHPGGQSFDVLDGAPGGMQASTYDPQGAVAAAGGIPAYVEAQIGGGTVSEDLLRDTVGWTGKNLLDIVGRQMRADDPAGLTVTNNMDGTYGITGTASATAINVWFWGGYDTGTTLFTLPAGDYIASDVNIYKTSSGSTGSVYTTIGGGDVAFSLSQPMPVCGVRCANAINGTTYNTTLKPMIRLASVADDTYEPYHESVEDYMLPQAVQNVMGAKNLLVYPYTDTTKTVNTVTFTDMGDGSIKVNTSSAATADAYFTLKDYKLPAGSYILSKGSDNVYIGLIAQAYNSSTWVRNMTQLYSQENAVLTIDYADYDRVRISVVVPNGRTADNLIIYPMARLTEFTDPTYEPYAMTNKQLTDAVGFYIELAASSATTYTFTDSRITANSRVDVYTDTYGDNPSNVVCSAGSCTVTFSAAQSRTVGIEVK